MKYNRRVRSTWRNPRTGLKASVAQSIDALQVIYQLGDKMADLNLFLDLLVTSINSRSHIRYSKSIVRDGKTLESPVRSRVLFSRDEWKKEQAHKKKFKLHSRFRDKSYREYLGTVFDLQELETAFPRYFSTKEIPSKPAIKKFLQPHRLVFGKLGRSEIDSWVERLRIAWPEAMDDFWTIAGQELVPHSFPSPKSIEDIRNLKILEWYGKSPRGYKARITAKKLDEIDAISEDRVLSEWWHEFTYTGALQNKPQKVRPFFSTTYKRLISKAKHGN